MVASRHIVLRHARRIKAGLARRLQQ